MVNKLHHHYSLFFSLYLGSIRGKSGLGQVSPLVIGSPGQ